MSNQIKNKITNKTEITTRQKIKILTIAANLFLKDMGSNLTLYYSVMNISNEEHKNNLNYEEIYHALINKLN